MKESEVKELITKDWEVWFGGEKERMEEANPDPFSQMALTSFSKFSFFAGYLAAAKNHL